MFNADGPPEAGYKEIIEMGLEVLEAERKKEELKIQAMIAQQRKDGKCHLKLLPKDSNQPFRSELTIERHPLFLVNTFEGKSWSLKRRVKDTILDEPVVQRIMVGKTNLESKEEYGVLKQVHQQALYKLLKIWAERGYPTVGDRGIIELSAYETVMAIRGNVSGNHYKRTAEILRGLAAIPIVISNAYSWRGIKKRDEFTLLEGVEWKDCEEFLAAKKLKRDDRSRVTIYLSERLTEGFRCKDVKILLLGPYELLGKKGERRGEIAKLIYTLLDHQLSTKNEYSISLKNLFERIGLKPQKYRSKRKERIQPTLALLNEKPINPTDDKKGIVKSFLRVSLEETHDKKDFKLVARKVRQ